MPESDVVVTGLGMVTPLGTDAATCAAAWQGGGVATRRVLPELAGTGLEAIGAAVVPDFDAAERLGGRRMLKYMSAAALLGCVAAHEAIRDADLRRRFAPEKIGLYAGTGLAAASLDEALPMIRSSLDGDGRISYRRLGREGLALTNPLLSFKILANMPPCLISILEGIKGPNLIFTPWEGQTAAAILEARQAVSSGEVEAAVCGAADNPSHPATFVFLIQAGFLGKKEYPAAGAAYLVFERAETAVRDGRRVYAQVADLNLEQAPPRSSDPLAGRLGRCFAAAPAVLLALAGFHPAGPVSISGADGQRFSATMTSPA